MDDIIAMSNFFLAPVLSFFSPSLYRRALQSGLGGGFVYLLYLTGLFLLLVVVLCRLFLLPETAKFMNWLVEATPEMAVTQTGLTTEAEQPYLATHPTFGPLYLMDTTKEASELLADSGKTPILIGKQDIIINDPQRHRMRTISLREAMLKSYEAHQPIRITKNVMRDLSARIQGMAVPFILVVLAPLFFVWKLLAALFYSLFALFFNLFRKEKFRYGGLFTLSCYALSPITVFQAVQFSVPDAHLNLNPTTGFALTVAYLFYGMFAVSRTVK